MGQHRSLRRGRKRKGRPPGLGTQCSEKGRGREATAGYGRTSLAFITSTNPNGKLFTDIKPILGTGTIPGPRTAGRQAEWAGFHLTASFPT